MRLGKDALEADLYSELGLLPDATDSEIRVAYRRLVRSSHPDLNRDDPDAAPRMLRLNLAARVLLNPELRRAYDHAPRGARKPRRSSSPQRSPEWFERARADTEGEWAPPATTARAQRTVFPSFFRELRGRDGRLSLRFSELLESLSARQQLGIAAALFAAAVGLVALAQPRGLMGDAPQPTSVSTSALYP